MKKALVLINPQVDFCSSSGAAYIKDGGKIIQTINRLLATSIFKTVVGCQSYYPLNHKLFYTSHEGKKLYDVIEINKTQCTLLSKHCLMGEQGSEFSKDLLTGRLSAIFRKGMDSEDVIPSVFYNGTDPKLTGLSGYLKETFVKELYVAGVPFEYSVKESVLDALQLDFKVNVIIDACKSVNLKPKEEKELIKKLEQAGAVVIKSDDLLKAGMRELNEKEGIQK